MAKTLAIKVKFSSDGEEKVIKNIDELEKSIEQLSNELKTLDFGSEEYEKTAAQLAKLRGEFRDVEKTVEGLDTEQRLTALAGATEVVAGSFLIASSAARTFGASAETVEEVEALEQQALEAVNIALGIRAVAEGIVQAAQLKRIVVEKAGNIQTTVATALQTAYTVAVGTSTGALKLFRLALIGTGIGAIIVLLGELIANWDKLTSAIGFSSKELSEYQKIQVQAQKDTAKSRIELDFYGGVVLDVSRSEQERAVALEELNRLGVITEGITLDNADALETLNERLELARDNILLKAQAEAASQLLTEALKSQIEAQNSTLEDNLAWWEQGLFTLQKYTSVTGFFLADSAARTKALKNQNEAIGEATDEVTKYEEIYLKFQEQLLQNEAKLREEREKGKKQAKEDNKEKEKRNKLDDEYNDLLKQITKNAEKYRKEINLLATAQRDEVEVVQRANKIIEEQNALLEERLGIFGTSQGEAEDFADTLERLLGGVIVPDELVILKDTFNEIFEIIDKGVGGVSGMIDDGSEFGVVYGEAGTEISKFLNLLDLLKGIEPFRPVTGEDIEEVGDLLSELGDYGIELLTEEQKQILIDFFDTQVRIQESSDVYNKNLQISVDTKTKELNAQDEYLKKQLESELISQDEYDRQVKLVNEQREKNKLKSEELAQEIDYNLLLNEIVSLQNTAVENGLSTVATNEKIQSLVAKRLFDEEDIVNLSEEQLKQVNNVTEALKNQSNTYTQVRDINEQLVQLNRQIEEGIEQQSKTLTEEQFKQLQAFVVANKDKIDTIKDFFSTATEETTNLTEEQIEAINKLIRNIEVDTIADKINDIATQVVQVFNDITGNIQGIISDSISLQLEQLDYYTEQALAQVGDETEKQRQIQEEIRQDAEKSRFELNQRARLTDLNFSLASTIANGAQAAINAIATVPPPGGQILAGIYAGLTAAQVAVINDQIGFVKSQQYQPARRGGLVIGNSHEYGGVIARNGLELEGGEAIINRNAVSQFGDLLSQINLSTGGRALTTNDSDIVQEIRQQNQTPIKTYVLYNDIQNTNKINSKLEQISRL